MANLVTCEDFGGVLLKYLTAQKADDPTVIDQIKRLVNIPNLQSCDDVNLDSNDFITIAQCIDLIKQSDFSLIRQEDTTEQIGAKYYLTFLSYDGNGKQVINQAIEITQFGNSILEKVWQQFGDKLLNELNNNVSIQNKIKSLVIDWIENNVEFRNSFKRFLIELIDSDPDVQKTIETLIKELVEDKTSDLYLTLKNFLSWMISSDSDIRGNVDTLIKELIKDESSDTYTAIVKLIEDIISEDSDNTGNSSSWGDVYVSSDGSLYYHTMRGFFREFGVALNGLGYPYFISSSPSAYMDDAPLGDTNVKAYAKLFIHRYILSSLYPLWRERFLSKNPKMFSSDIVNQADTEIARILSSNSVEESQLDFIPMGWTNEVTGMVDGVYAGSDYLLIYACRNNYFSTSAIYGDDVELIANNGTTSKVATFPVRRSFDDFCRGMVFGRYNGVSIGPYPTTGYPKPQF